HGVPDLRWNEQLAAQAQLWAEKVAKQAHISYKELSGVGENITFFPRDLSPEAIVEHWYEEHEKYEYETPGWQYGTNYFTQIIWRETEEIGIGRAFVQSDVKENQDGKTLRAGKLAYPGDQVIVAFYSPAGNNNRAGQFAGNVLKPLKRREPIAE
ncbi:SCP-like protein, partial [Dictyocaulus viviparus]